jgi:hypothetical protein
LHLRGRKGAGGWRRLHNEELHNFYASPNIIKVIKSRRMRWQMRNTYNILVGKPEGERPLRRPRHRWEDNIRMDLRELGWEGVYWMHLNQDREQRRAPVKTIIKLQVP